MKYGSTQLRWYEVTGESKDFALGRGDGRVWLGEFDGELHEMAIAMRAIALGEQVLSEKLDLRWTAKIELPINLEDLEFATIRDLRTVTTLPSDASEGEVDRAFQTLFFMCKARRQKNDALLAFIQKRVGFGEFKRIVRENS